MSRIAVVGAGPSGLPCIRHALLYGHEPVVFELSDGVGGLWNFKPTVTDQSSVARTTIANTSKELMAYSDFPPPARFANFMRKEQLHEYYKLYAEHFGLRKHIRFQHKVLNVRRSDSYSEDGTWVVAFKDLVTGEHKEEKFDGVLMAQGHHFRAHTPSWSGMEDFSGRILHSQCYKDSRDLEDKTVVVVGMGNSGCDIAVDVSRMAKQVHLSTRRGAWIFARIGENGLPYDVSINTRFNAVVRSYFFNYCNKDIEKQFQKRFDHGAYGIKPEHGVFNCSPTINDELPYCIMNGAVKIEKNIKEFTKNGVIFEDSTAIDNVDYVYLATGYTIDFSIIEEGQLMDKEVNLYLHMFPPELHDHNNLAIIGLVQPSGPLGTTAELQARLFFEAFAKNLKLPPKSRMQESIEAHRAMQAGLVKSMRHTLEIDYCAYVDELTTMLGCNPNLLQLMSTDPKLAYTYFFGPHTMYGYRLLGPHPWEGARDAILNAQERIMIGLNPKCNERSGDSQHSMGVSSMWIIILAVLVGYLFMRYFDLCAYICGPK